jgi:hypothetical protein
MRPDALFLAAPRDAMAVGVAEEQPNAGARPLVSD